MAPKKNRTYPEIKARRLAARKRLANAPREVKLDRSSKDWTEKQRRFVDAFCRHGVGWKAVLEAGYNTDKFNAMKYAGELRRQPHIAAYLDQWHLDRQARFN